MTTHEHSSVLRQQVRLLVAQAVCLGLTLAFLVVTAISSLLSTYGSGALPYVYIAVAVLGAATFYGLAELQRRQSLVRVSVFSELAVIAFLALAWAGLVIFDADWLSFALLVSFSLLLQVGFVILGGQAGRLLDVRQIKRYFPRVVSGFAVGFTIGGALVGPLQRLLGNPDHLLAVAALTACALLGFLLATSARFGEALRLTRGSEPELPTPPLRRLLTKRFVVLIFVYQMLSAMASQLLDFMVLDATGARFTDQVTLARFFGNYTFFLNLADILFLALAAGFLLSRFGLRFGLSANPAVVVLMLVAILITGLAAGPASLLFFWLVVITRPMDIVFTDGTTRTSINAAYQALPPQERVAVQTGVEGIGVPVALGLTGVLLLVFNWLGDVGLMQVAAVTLVLSLLWTGAGLLVYRNYAASLVETLRRRVLKPVELTLDDSSALPVVEGLLDSGRLRDVRLALDMLAGAEHPSLDGHLMRLAQRPEPQIQVEALSRIESRPGTAARPVVERLLADSGDPAVRGAALRALCAIDGAAAAPAARSYLADPAPELRAAAMVGLLRSRSLDVHEERRELARWQAGGIQDRRLLAKAIGEAGRADLAPVLRAVLQDEDLGVRREALESTCRLALADLLPEVVESLKEPATRSAAAEALVSIGPPVLPLVASALEGTSGQSVKMVERLVRVCGQVGGEPAISLLRQHLAHPDADVRTAVLEALGASDFRAEGADRQQVTEAMRQESRQAAHVLAARQDIGEGPEVAALRTALDDELRLARRRVFLLLGFLYDAQAMARAEQLFAKGSRSEKALGLEMLDVALAREHKALALPLVDPDLDPRRQRPPEASSLNRVTRLRAILENEEGVPLRPWVQACAAYATARLGLQELATPVAALLQAEDPVVRETAAWAVGTLSEER